MKALRLFAAGVLALAAVWAVNGEAVAAYDADVVIACEQTTTTGTGTVNLDGAYTSGTYEYVAFNSQVSSGDDFEYTITASDGKIEHGRGTLTTGSPDTLTRTARWSSDGSGAELNLPSGTHTVCARWGPGTLQDGVTALNIASIDFDGTTDTTITRLGAGRIAVEGAGVWTTPGTGLSDSLNTLNCDAASTSAVGCMEFATSGEAEAGTATDKAVNPDALLDAVTGRETLGLQAMSFVPTGTAGATPYYAESSGLTNTTLQFPDGSDTNAQVIFVLPESWDAGTLSFEVFWTYGSGSGTIEFDIQCGSYSDNDAASSSAFGTAVSATDTGLAVFDVHITAETSALTVGGTPSKGDLIVCNIERDVSADTLSGSVFLYWVNVFYTTDAMTDD